MPHYRLAYDPAPGNGHAAAHEFDVPSLHIALVVAGINAGEGSATIRDGERVLARLERYGQGNGTYWQVA